MLKTRILIYINNMANCIGEKRERSFENSDEGNDRYYYNGFNSFNIVLLDTFYTNAKS